MDFQGKESYLASDCPHCKKPATEDKNLCGGCGKEIKPLLNVPSGYQSPASDHWHNQGVGGSLGYSAVFKTLCIDCYRKAWEKTYPKVKVPV